MYKLEDKLEDKGVMDTHVRFPQPRGLDERTDRQEPL
jgi:hypothetical protein